MDLEDAIEQYVTMVALGVQALQRLSGSLDQSRKAEMTALLDEIADQAERLKAFAAGTSQKPS